MFRPLAITITLGVISCGIRPLFAAPPVEPENKGSTDPFSPASNLATDPFDPFEPRDADGGNRPSASRGSLRDTLNLADLSMAAAVTQILESPASLPADDDVTIDEFREALENVFGVPVLISAATERIAQLKDAPPVAVTPGFYPLKTQLQHRLAPVGLRAVATEDGLELTADTFALTRRGVDVDQWVSVDEQTMTAIQTALSKPAGFLFLDQPLNDVLNVIGSTHDLPIRLDRRSIETLGLTEDTPISIAIKGVPVYDALLRMLGELDCTITVEHGQLTVLSQQDADERPLSRIYWFDAARAGDRSVDQMLDSYGQLITTSVRPTGWKTSGGINVIEPVDPGRPGLLIAADYVTHVEVKRLLDAMRRSGG